MGKRKGKLTKEYTKHDGENNHQGLIKFLEANKGFELLFYKSSVPKALSDVTTKKIIAVNKAWEEFSGYNGQEVIGFSALDLQLVEVKHNSHIREELENKDSLKSYEAVFLLKNGDRKETLISFDKIVIDESAYVLSEIMDLSELKESKKLLNEQKEFSQNILSSLREGLSVVDLEGIHIEVNPALCEMTGFSKEELIGSKPPHLYWPPEEYENIDVAFQNTLKGATENIKLIFMRKTGERFPVSLAISSVKDEDGNIIAYFSTINDITQQLQAKEELRLAKEFSEELVTSLRQGLVVMNLDGEIIDVNPAFCTITEFKKKELLGTTAPFSFWPPESYEAVQACLKQTLSGEVGNFNFLFMRKSGERFTASLATSSIKDKQGTIIAFFVTIDDVSDQVNAQTEMRIAKEFSENLVQSLADGLSIVSLDNIQIEVNPALCKMTGFKREELVGHKIPAKFWPPESYEDIRSALAKSRAGEGNFHELVFMRKNGDRFPVAISTSSIQKEGKAIAHFGVIQDITEHVKAKNEIVAAKEFSESLLVSMQEGLTVVNAEAEITSVNHAICRMTGFSEKELVGKKVPFPFWPPEYHDDFNARYEEIMKGQLYHGFETTYMRKNGERFPVQLLVTQIRDKHKNVIATFATVQDITERVKAEQEILMAKEFSENVVSSMYEGLVIVSIQDGRITNVNPSFCRMTGYSEAEILATTAPFPFWAPEYFDSCTTYFRKTLKEDSEQSFEAIYKHKNGKRFPVQVISSQIVDNTGKAISILATIRDVSEQVKAKNLLKETAEKSNLRKNTILELASLVGEDFEETLKKITSLTAKTLDIDRVSVWKFTKNRSEIHCEKLYVQNEDAFFSEMMLKKTDNPAYFEALKLNRTISVTNTFENDITKDFTDDYLKPNNISSLLDVFIQGLDGQYGVFCFENVGPCRIWTADEEEFASSIANLVSLMVQSSERIAVKNRLRIVNSDLLKAVGELNEFKDQLQNENIYLRDELDMVFNFEEMVYGSAVFSQVLTDVEKVAPTSATALLLGETGTGKELLARAIHKTSDRKNKPLIKVNCAAIPRELIESELFGHKKGSFTGAVQDKIGKVELAHEGTLFLDEIGELPISMQPKLLRFLQEGEIEKIGETTSRKLDVRVIAATNRDLQFEIKENRFREDLYYRLNVFPITVPPLRERQEDIPLLVEHFVDKFGKRYKKNVKYVSDAAMSEMQNYKWPGNIRELENLIERSVILSSTEHLVLTDFDLLTETTKRLISSTNLSLDESQRLHIIRVLEKCNWNIDGAAGASNLLKIKPSTLRDRMKKLKINRPD